MPHPRGLMNIFVLRSPCANASYSTGSDSATLISGASVSNLRTLSAGSTTAALGPEWWHVEMQLEHSTAADRAAKSCCRTTLHASAKH